jgi:RHS repeat-associated protein
MNVRTARYGVLVLLLLVSCAQSGDVKGGASADDSASVGEGLSASPNLSAALQGRVQPAANSVAGALIAAATTGNTTVGPDGSASYRVPIWVPDGVRGMQPSLAITYESAGSLGLLGKKWGISGLSSIKRCQRTMAEDGAPAPLNLAGDDFCLDGERLVRLTGMPRFAGEFRTEKNPFARIVAAQAPSLGIASFQVFEPDGTVLFYGRTAASRLMATPKSFFNLLPPRIATFYLDKIQDRFGNSVLISYSSPSPMSTEVSQLVPTSIQWGGVLDTAGQRSIQFNYVGSTAGDPAHERWAGGLGVLGGQRLDNLSISGPDGVGNVGVLKTYRFGYGTPTVTGENLLTSISECDANNACKHSTKISWEAGSWQYARTNLSAAPFGINDVGLPGLSSEDLYRRILVADLNHDGRDDIVYRTVGPSLPSGAGSCLGWSARLAQPGRGFGDPVSLAGPGPDSDPNCTSASTIFAAYPGDLLFADVNRDGFPDIVSPVGQMEPQTGGVFPKQYSYGVYLNSALAGNTPSFGPRTAFEDASLVHNPSYCNYNGGSVDGNNPLIAFGDIDGDGTPDIVRPNYVPLGVVCNSYPPAGGLSAFSLFQTGSGSGTIITESARLLSGDLGPNYLISGFSTLDADGDGVAEILTDRSDANGPYTQIESPTIAPQRLPGVPRTNIPQMSAQTGSPPSIRWILDLNGDGLKDIATVYASDPTTIVTAISTGQGFPTTDATQLPANAQVGRAWLNGADSGVRVVDFNLDGRDDLVLVDNGWNGSGASRLIQAVLLSDGKGGFTPLDTSAVGSKIPVGDSATGWDGWFAPGSPGSTGYRTSVALDANGDGLPDFLQLEGGQLILYTRQGNVPDVVTSIVEGTGRTTAIAYAPATDPTVYTPDYNACASDLDHLSCFIGGRLLTRLVTVSAFGSMIAKSQTFRYAGGLSDRGGLGFLGFKQRDVYGPASRHVTEYSNPGAWSYVGAAPTGVAKQTYAYPNAFRPYLVRTQVDTATGTNTHRSTDRYLRSTFLVQNPSAARSTYSSMPFESEEFTYDCPVATTATGTTCGGAQRSLGFTDDVRYFDAYGNLTSDTMEYFDETGALARTDTETDSYTPDPTGTWLVRLLNQKQVTSITASPPDSVTRTTKYTPDLNTNVYSGLPTGEIHTTEIEPTGDGSIHLLRTFGRDVQGRLTSVSDSGFPMSDDCSGPCNPRCNASCGASCAGAGPGTGSCVGGCMGGCVPSCIQSCVANPNETRTTTYQYEDGDGVYVTTTTDPVGNKSRVWRHIGYGYVVETDDPNGAAAIFNYDTFGRSLGQTAASGASTGVTYSDPAADPISGAGMTVTPENNPTRAMTMHLDPFGNETVRTWAIDATRTAKTGTLYDGLGRVSRRLTSATSSKALVSDELFSYDDLNRVLTDCRLAPDGVRHCWTNSYDGLAVTRTDESGRTRTETSDTLGRPFKDSAVVVDGTSGQTVTSDTLFTYGAFGQLEHEFTSNGSGSTDLAYDVLGRRTSLKRAGVFLPLVEAYDGFGEVRARYKLNPVTGAKLEMQTFTHDALGRVTSQSSPGSGSGSPALNRHFYWDRSSGGSTVVNGLGRLNDIIDTSYNVIVHNEYNLAGQPTRKAWSIFNPAFGYNERWIATSTYDSQGRLSTLTYPRLLTSESAPLAVQYTYDPYLGVPSTVVEQATGAVIWSAAARNERGEPTTETMAYAGGPAITRSTDYYLQNGRVQDATLSSAATGNPQAQLSYTYQADGLPASFGTSNASGVTSTTFDYDNLDRLTSWVTAPNTTVQWLYDTDGNLAYRGWGSPIGGENATYTSTAPDASGASTRAMAVNGSGFENYTDAYQVDGFGRVRDTPAVSITTTDDDKLGAVTEKATGQVDTLVYDGNGARVLTVYGANGSAGTLLTLDDLFEVRRDASGTEERCRLRAGGRLIGDVVSSGTTTRTASFYLEDNAHSVIAEASSAGAVSPRALRDPFGNLVSSVTTPGLPRDPGGTDPDGSSRLGFGGHERDKNWGLVDMLARAYSPRLGRFIGPDSVISDPTDRRAFNPFAYVQNRPTAGVDPLGADPDFCDEGACAANALYEEEAAMAEVSATDVYMSVDTGAPAVGVGSDFGASASVQDGAGAMSQDLTSQLPEPTASTMAADAMASYHANSANTTAYDISFSAVSSAAAAGCNASPCAAQGLQPIADSASINPYPTLSPLPDVVFHAPTVAVAELSYGGTLVLGPMGGYAEAGISLSAHGDLEFKLGAGWAGGLAIGVDHGFSLSLSREDVDGSRGRFFLDAGLSTTTNVTYGPIDLGYNPIENSGEFGIPTKVPTLELEPNGLIGAYQKAGVSVTFGISGTY